MEHIFEEYLDCRFEGNKLIILLRVIWKNDSLVRMPLNRTIKLCGDSLLIVRQHFQMATVKDLIMGNAIITPPGSCLSLFHPDGITLEQFYSRAIIDPAILHSSCINGDLAREIQNMKKRRN
jgi:hypothetical protein